MTTPRIPIPMDQIERFCEKWKITELALFGSVLRDDFGPESDVDVLVTFAPDASWSLFDIARVKGDLEGILGRDVDIVEKRALESHHNPWLRASILGGTQSVYRATAA